MAISLDELAAVALEGSVGPLTIAVGAGALAVALAAGSTRPLRRIASTSIVTAGRTGQLNPIVWFEAARRNWTSLVAEARAEYEASRGRSSTVGPSNAVISSTDGTSSVVVASSTGAVPESGSVIVVPGADDPPASLDAPETTRKRNQRGRFTRRARNGAQPE